MKKHWPKAVSVWLAAACCVVGIIGAASVIGDEPRAGYAISSIVTGYYKDEDWVWKEYFRPRWEF